MTPVYCFPLSEEATVVVNPTRIRHVSLDHAAHVNAIWEGRDTTRFLFDAPLVSLVQYSPSSLIGELVDFRMWYACCQDPELWPILDVHPLAVTGLTTWRGKVLVGKRSATLSSYPGAMECCPSGSLDAASVRADGTVDLRQAILGELVEETGIRRESVRSARPKGLYMSTESDVFDILVEIELYPEVDQLISRPRSEEYDELHWIQKEEARLSFQERPWVPLSQFLLKEDRQ
jgi:8-oxo-dGTP pyrophosphatase MutT (NUDIX family)